MSAPVRESSACGKVIVLGEHAVVYGFDALAVSLDRGVRVRAFASPEHTLNIPSWKASIKPSDSGELAVAYAAVIAACEPAIPLRLEAELSIPAGAGLGCSAALGTAIARALLQSEDHEPSAIALFDATQTWERIFHGTPSGIDAWAAQGMGAFRFERGRVASPLAFTSPPHFVVCHSGSAGSTREMVTHVATQCGREPSTTLTLQEIGNLVGEGETALERGDLAQLGQAMDANHEALAMLGVSTAALDNLCQTLRGLGAMGAKLTGSGGGGCALALFDSAERATTAVSALSHDHDPCFMFVPGLGDHAP